MCIFTLGSGGLKGFLFDDVSRAIVKCIKMRMSTGGHAFLQYRFEVRRKRKLLSATERILECTRCHDIHISSLPILSLTITKRYRALSYFPQLTFPINSRKIRNSWLHDITTNQSMTTKIKLRVENEVSTRKNQNAEFLQG